MRVKAVIAYDGSVYQGFQKQTSTENTVTTAIEKALQDLQINTSITGSGRTDAGVHATGQVIHFDLPYFWNDLSKLTWNLNKRLNAVRFKHISPVEEAFHARFSAKNRIYRYVFKTKPISIFERLYVSHYTSFDTQLLQHALKLYEGEHDFAYFHKTGSDVNSTIRTIFSAHYKDYGQYHILYFEANGFLRSQVRMMVEAAMQCTQGKLTLAQLKEQINRQKRYTTKPAPPEGLYLARILY